MDPDQNDHMRIIMADQDIPQRKMRVTRGDARALQKEGLKRCTTCKAVKPHADFAKGGARWDGLNPKCRTCCAEYCAQRTLRDPDWQKEHSARHRALHSDDLNRDARRRYHADIEASRAKCREKRIKNPESVKNSARKYREENRDKCNEYSRLRKAELRKQRKELGITLTPKERSEKRKRARIYQEKNREAINERQRLRHAERMRSDLEYKGRCLANSAKYHAKNPDKIRSIRRNRKARIRNADGRHTEADVAEILAMQKGRCADPSCRKKLGDKYHVDHIVPIAKGGSNDRSNLQIMHPACNQRKSAKDPIIWAQENGFLL